LAGVATMSDSVDQREADNLESETKISPEEEAAATTGQETSPTEEIVTESQPEANGAEANDSAEQVDSEDSVHPDNANETAEDDFETPLDYLDAAEVEEIDSTAIISNDDCVFSLLTPDIVIRIFSMLDIPDLVNAQLVSQEWFAYARCDTLWSSLYESTDWILSPPQMELEEATWYDLYRLHYAKELDQLNTEYYVEEEEDEVQKLYNLLQSVDELTTEKLRQLLQLEEFVTLLQNGDDVVLTFLETPATILTMMDLLFKEDHDPDELQSQRTVHIVVQTLVSGIITDVFIINPDLLDALFDQLDELDLKAPGSQTKGSCISKIISILFEKFTTQIIGHLANRETFIPTLLLNVHDQNLMEILLKFVDCDITHQWLFEAELITRLIALLHKDETLETQEHATNVLVNILALCQAWPHSVLINDTLNNEIITGSVIAFMESKPYTGESIKLGLRVLIGILGLISDELEDPPIVVSLLANSMGFFAKILENSDQVDSSESFTTTTGPIEKGFGFVRLGILELLVALLYTGFPIVVEFMLAENIFTIVLNLLFQYPWNNIIHNQISQLYSGLFCCNNPEVIQAVLAESRLPERISEAHKNENSVGYLGHLRELANELVRASKMSEPIGEYLKGVESWQSFVDEDLKEFNLIECVVQDDYLDYENQYFQEQYDEYEMPEADSDIVISEDFEDAEPIPDEF